MTSLASFLWLYMADARAASNGTGCVVHVVILTLSAGGVALGGGSRPRPRIRSKLPLVPRSNISASHTPNAKGPPCHIH